MVNMSNDAKIADIGNGDFLGCFIQGRDSNEERAGGTVALQSFFWLMEFLVGNACCSDVSRSAAQGSELNFRAFGHIWECPSMEFLRDSLEESLADGAMLASKIHGAAKDDDAGVDRMDDAGRANPQVEGRFVDDFQCKTIAFQGGFVNVFGGQGFALFENATQ